MFWPFKWPRALGNSTAIRFSVCWPNDNAGRTSVVAPDVHLDFNGDVQHGQAQVSLRSQIRGIARRSSATRYFPFEVSRVRALVRDPVWECGEPVGETSRDVRSLEPDTQPPSSIDFFSQLEDQVETRDVTAPPAIKANERTESLEPDIREGVTPKPPSTAVEAMADKTNMTMKERSSQESDTDELDESVRLGRQRFNAKQLAASNSFGESVGWAVIWLVVTISVIVASYPSNNTDYDYLRRYDNFGYRFESGNALGATANAVESLAKHQPQSGSTLVTNLLLLGIAFLLWKLHRTISSQRTEAPQGR